LCRWQYKNAGNDSGNLELFAVIVLTGDRVVMNVAG
jgi:hypothetical protein